MKKLSKFRVGDIVSYNSRGKKLITHKELLKQEGQLFKIFKITQNSAYIENLSNEVSSHCLLNTKYLEMIKPGSHHPLTSIFGDD